MPRRWLERPRKIASKVTARTARRITGISTPFGGLQWADPGPSDTEIVRRFLLFLEDRRVLYNPMHLEVTSQVEHSIHEIRHECTKTLQELAPGAFAVFPVRAIREAGRRFHDDQNEDFRFFDNRWSNRGGSPAFSQHLALIARRLDNRLRSSPPIMTSTLKALLLPFSLRLRKASRDPRRLCRSIGSHTNEGFLWP